MKRINFIAILLLIFTLSFIYIENIKALEEEPTIEEEEKMANERIEEQQYYFKEDLTTPVINIYKEIDGNGNINYKYEILNEKVINTGFNIFYNENGQIFKFYLFDNNEIAHSLTKINNKYYTFNEEGKMLYGWQTINNKKYYFSILTGEAYIGIKTINNKTYYFSNNGQLLTGIYKVNGYIYYFTSNGIQTGLKKVNNKYYYFEIIYIFPFVNNNQILL